MKQRTKDRAIKWLESAKKMDLFYIDTVPHSKSDIEQLLGIKPSKKIQPKINKDIEEKSYGDLGEEFSEADSKESGD